MQPEGKLPCFLGKYTKSKRIINLRKSSIFKPTCNLHCAWSIKVAIPLAVDGTSHINLICANCNDFSAKSEELFDVAFYIDWNSES